MKVVRSLAFLSLAGFVVACGSKDSAPAAASETPAAAPATSSAPDVSEPSANDISNYKLDMDKMTKYANAMKGFGALGHKDSTALEAISTDANENMAQSIAKIEASPIAMNVLRNAGLSAKDFVWITAAWLQAGMTQGMLESVKGAKLPDGQNAQNIEFLKAHKAELDAMTKEMGGKQ
jgi:hypothetical protein